MPTKQSMEERPAPNGKERAQRNSEIAATLLQALGSPTNLHSVQVRPLWGNQFRVNVLMGADAASIKVAHSYFLSVDNEGRIVTSTPTITKLY